MRIVATGPVGIPTVPMTLKLPTLMVTVLPSGACVPAAGFWLVTWPIKAVMPTGTFCAETLKPVAVRTCWA